MITTTIETWGPAEAAAALATMKRNRLLSPMTARKYANDMAAGRWQFTGESIQFDEDECLINGQHRCTGLASLPPETRITFLVVRGIPDDAQMVMDQGRIRQTGQQLQMRGVRNAAMVAGGVRIFLAHQTGLMFRDNTAAREVITTAYIEEWVQSNRETVESLNEIATFVKASDAPPSVAYAAALIFWKKNPTATVDFFRTLAKGGAREDSSITVLDKRLQRHRREGIKISNRDTLGLYIQAWNAWRKGQTFSRFQRPRGGHWTEATFPKPVA